MKMLALVLLVVSACEHDPRYERHEDRRPAATPVQAPAKTVERPVVDDPPPVVAAPVRSKIVPLNKRTHHRRH